MSGTITRLRHLGSALATVVLALMLGTAPASSYEIRAVEDGGSVRGRVGYGGTQPARPSIPVSKDRQFCHAEVPDESVVVGEDGGLANVVVYFQDVPAGKDPAELPEIVLANEECRFQPHVSALMVGQRLIVSNEDPVLHNTHAFLGERSVFNRALPLKGQRQKVKMKRPGPLSIRCDAGHTWMSAWVMVTENPYYAVTDEEGRFEIRDIPPGKYVVRAWHETFGEQEQSVRIEAAAAVEMELTFGESPSPE